MRTSRVFSSKTIRTDSVNQEQESDYVEINDSIIETIKNGEITHPNENFILFYFFWMGGVSYVAWSAVLNSLDYFAAMFPGRNTSFVLPLAPYSSQLIMTVLVTYLSNIISYKWRLYIGMILIMFTTQMIPYISMWFQNTSAGMALTFIALFFLGAFNNVVYASAAGFVSQVSGKFTAFFLMGVAFFGLVQNIFKESVVKTYDEPADDDLAPVVVYFTLTNLLVLVGIILHAVFVRTSMYESVSIGIPQSFTNLPEETQEQLLKASKPIGIPKKDFSTMLDCARYAWQYLALIIIAVIQLNMTYPGVVLKKPVDGLTDQDKTVSMITTFSIFYIFGKYLGKYRQHYNKRTVISIVLLRFLMFAFIIIQAVTVSFPILSTFTFGYLNLAAFGLSMGFINVAIFIMAPEQVSPEKKEVAGFLSVFAINLGALAGGLLALTLKNIGFSDDSSSGGG